MKLTFAKHSILLSLIFGTLAAHAGMTENFNSRKGISITQLKSSLQNSCWTFHHFDINHNGWNPGIEGDGAMVSNAETLSTTVSAIFTPVLMLPSTLELSFEYTFNENFSDDSRRWIKLCLVNSRNEIEKVLEELQLIGLNATRPSRYSTAFSNLAPGEYRLMLQYGGSGGTARIAIDELQVSAPFKYEGGCNTAPRGLRDRVTGLTDRTASGSVLANDKDGNNEKFSAYLIKGSAHGKVDLSEDGSFLFTPAEGFDGNSTSFVYKVCDEGTTNLCSENTTVHINFPNITAAAPGLVDFKGSYKNNGMVELAWRTSHTSKAGSFEIERSLDGKSWETPGKVQATLIKANVNDYAYSDQLKRNTAHKKDIYYRLKQVSADGTFTLSKLLIVRVYNTRSLSMISVTPNPAKNDIAVNVQLQEKSFISMRILNNTGGLVLHKGLNATEGLHTFLVDGSSGLQPGLYMLEVIVNSKERMLVKLVKE